MNRIKTTLITLAAVAATVALSGCSSFKLGAACYVPYGVTGQCSATTVEPGATPAVTTRAETQKKI